MAKKVIAGCLAVAVLGGLAYYSSYLYTSRDSRENSNYLQQKKAEQETVLPEAVLPKDAYPENNTEERQETVTDPASVQTETEPYSYYLVEEFGYVNIYLADKESIYEYTDISIDSLPEELQMEICTGKGIATEQELYDFLENYSS